MSIELLKQIDKTLEIAASTHKLGANIMRSLEAARDALKPGVWEPSGGSYYIRNDARVRSAPSDETARLACTEFGDESEANRVAKLRREWQLIAKYVSDHAPGYEPNWDDSNERKYFIVFDHRTHVQEYIAMTVAWSRDISAVYMPFDVAQQLVNDLNNGRVKL